MKNNDFNDSSISIFQLIEVSKYSHTAFDYQIKNGMGIKGKQIYDHMIPSPHLLSPLCLFLFVCISVGLDIWGRELKPFTGFSEESTEISKDKRKDKFQKTKSPQKFQKTKDKKILEMKGVHVYI